jgi:poly(3-hydroxybutyrate) depolymerase
MRSGQRRWRLQGLVIGVVSVAVSSLVFAPAGTATSDDLSVPARSTIYERVNASASCGSSSGTRMADGRMADWVGDAGGVTGTGYYAGGEYIWTDYTYDDAGTGQFVYPAEGELLERDDDRPGRISPLMNRYGASAADIVEMRLAADDSSLHVAVVLNFLNAVDTTVVTLGFDIDRDDATGVGTWPLGAGLTTPGADVFVTAHPTDDGFCATVSDRDGERAVTDIGGGAAVGTSDNVIEISIPLGVLGGGPVVEVVGGSGLWDGADGRWKRPVRGAKSPLVPEELRAGEADDVRGGIGDNDPGVFNLLFRGDEEMIDLANGTDAASDSSKRAFEHLRQAAVLQTGTSGDYRLDLDLTRIAPGAPAEPVPTRRGELVEFTRQYESRVDLEGLVWVENDISRDIIYLGRRQSYAVHLPPCLGPSGHACPEGGVPLAVSFHGGSGSHINQLEDMASSVSVPMASRAEVMTLAPFGRGRRAPWWRGLGEVDVLEAIADAERAYPVDRDRRLAYGGSLGGYATLRFSSLYPDMWAGAAAFCPATYENSTSTREPGNEAPETQHFTVFPLIGSLVNTPLLQVSGTIDPLVRINNGHRLRDLALAEGLDVRYTEWFNGHHCTWVPETSQRFPDWHVPEMLSMLERGRSVRPATVTYASDPRQLTPGVEWLAIAHLDDVGVRHDRAWWVSNVRVRDDVVAAASSTGTEIAGNTFGAAGDDVVGRIRAVSHMLPGWTRGAAPCGNEVGLAGISGNPEVEQTPGSVTGSSIPEPHHFVCQRQTRATPILEPVLELETTNLAAVTIDRDAANLGAKFILRAAGDGEVEVSLLGGAGRRALGPCVRSQRAIARGLAVTITANPTPCTIAVG